MVSVEFNLKFKSPHNALIFFFGEVKIKNLYDRSFFLLLKLIKYHYTKGKGGGDEYYIKQIHVQ